VTLVDGIANGKFATCQAVLCCITPKPEWKIKLNLKLTLSYWWKHWHWQHGARAHPPLEFWTGMKWRINWRTVWLIL